VGAHCHRGQAVDPVRPKINCGKAVHDRRASWDVLVVLRASSAGFQTTIVQPIEYAIIDAADTALG
jgi:hypothetical protein